MRTQDFVERIKLKCHDSKVKATRFQCLVWWLILRAESSTSAHFSEECWGVSGLCKSLGSASLYPTPQRHLLHPNSISSKASTAGSKPYEQAW